MVLTGRSISYLLLPMVAFSTLLGLARGDEPIGSCDAAHASIGCDSFTSGMCCGERASLFERSTLTGDWFGFGPEMKKRGLRLQVFNTQYFGGVVSGGREQDFEYGGRLDYLANLDGQKAGLWQGLFLSMHAETRYGKDVNSIDGLLAPSNIAMNFPDATANVTSITGLKLTQALSESFAIYGGKLNSLDDFAIGYGRATGNLPMLAGFQAMALVANPIGARTIPYSSIGAGTALIVDKKPLLTLTVIDPEDRSTKGAQDLFERGVTIISDLTVEEDMFGMPSVLNLGGIYSNSKYRTLDPASYLNLIELGELQQAIVNGGPVETGSWALYGNASRALWVDPCDRSRRWAVFAGAGISDGNPNPLKYTISAGIGGRTMNSNRPLDAFGLGYFYLGLSDEIKRLTSVFRPQRDEHGFEMFYNAAITPWCRLTPNFQVITPSSIARDTTLITGIRLHAIF
jgi:porin